MENEVTNNKLTGNYADQGNLLDVIEDDSFSYKGYQVVRGEFFAHINEPSVTFSGNKVSVNRTCLKKVPNFDYMQILVNPEARKLAIRPCAEETPKQVTCRVFFAKVFSLMGWDMSYRYKLLGKLIRSGGDLLFVFDLTEPEIFTHIKIEDGKIKKSRTPFYPEEWKNQFGLPVEQHENTVQVSLFNKYTVFGIQKKENQPVAESEGSNDEQ